MFLAASIVSMIATPFLIAAAPKIGFYAQRLLKDGGAYEVPNSEEEGIHLTSSGGLHQHVVIVGYGLNGRNLARVLRSVGVPYTILEVNAEVVRRAKDRGEKVNFGDATRRDVLLHAGLERAWVLVLAMSDPQAARRTVDQARQINRDVRIVVRTRYVSEITELYELGADEVIPEEFETSIEIFSRVLHRYGFKRNVIEGQIDRIREQGYEMLRSPTVPQEPVALPAGLDAASTETIFLSRRFAGYRQEAWRAEPPRPKRCDHHCHRPRRRDAYQPRRAFTSLRRAIPSLSSGFRISSNRPGISSRRVRARSAASIPAAPYFSLQADPPPYRSKSERQPTFPEKDQI